MEDMMAKEDSLKLIEEDTEFETKYMVEASALTEFKRIMDNLPNLKKFIYVEGPDEYFNNEYLLQKFLNFGERLKGEDRVDFLALVGETIGEFPPFIRFRRPSHGLDGNRQELTTKYKREGAKNNIQREEKNVRVDITPSDTIRKFVKDMGYEHNFSVWKTCHIYNFTDATLVYYSTYDITDGPASKVENFFEIELDEATVSRLTVEEGWDTIIKYEKMFEHLGVTPQKRLKKSLYDRYKRSLSDMIKRNNLNSL